MTARPLLGRRHYLLLTAAFFLFVIYGSFVPLHYHPMAFDDVQAKFARRMSRGINFDMRSDWAANVLLFIPLGYLCMGMLTADRPKPAWGLALIPCFALLSAAIEFAQNWFPARDTNPNDIVAETIGGVIGVAAWIVVGQALTERFRQFMASYGPGDWAVRVLPAYLLFLVFTHGMPFDLSMSPSLIWHKHKRQLDDREKREGIPMMAVTPPPSLVPEKTLMSVAYFVPVGALLAFLPGRRWRHSWALVLGTGMLIAAGIEVLQLSVLSCSAFASDVPLGAACIFLGWKAATWPTAFPRLFWMAGSVGWVAALAAVLWLPFDFQNDRLADWANQFEFMPFREYIDANYLNGMNKIVHRCVMYVPAGFLAARAVNIRVTEAGVLGAFLGLFMEMGQLMFTDHTASVSDVILGGLGAWCGALVASRARKTLAAGPVAPPKADIPPFRLL